MSEPARKCTCPACTGEPVDLAELQPLNIQPLNVVAGMWRCAWCAAGIENLHIHHAADCWGLAALRAEGAADERERILSPDLLSAVAQHTAVTNVLAMLEIHGGAPGDLAKAIGVAFADLLDGDPA